MDLPNTILPKQASDPSDRKQASDPSDRSWEALLELSVTSRDITCDGKSEGDITVSSTYSSTTMQSSQHETGELRLPSATTGGSAGSLSTSSSGVIHSKNAVNKKNRKPPTRGRDKHLVVPSPSALELTPTMSALENHLPADVSSEKLTLSSPTNGVSLESNVSIQSDFCFHFTPLPRASTYKGFHADLELQKRLQEEQDAMDKLEMFQSFHVREHVDVETVDSDVDFVALRRKRESEEYLAQRRRHRQHQTMANVVQIVLMGFVILAIVAVSLGLTAITQYGLIAVVLLSLIVGFVLGLAYFVQHHVLAQPVETIHPRLQPIHRTIQECVDATCTFFQDEVDAFRSEWKDYMLLLENGAAEGAEAAAGGADDHSADAEQRDGETGDGQPRKSVGFRVLKPFLRARQRILRRKKIKSSSMELSRTPKYQPPDETPMTQRESTADAIA